MWTVLQGCVRPRASLFVLWHFRIFSVLQGENNGGQAEYYSCAFPTMVTDWRSRLNMPTMWFGGVQLAPASNGVYAENFVGIRDAQLSVFTSRTRPWRLRWTSVTLCRNG